MARVALELLRGLFRFLPLAFAVLLAPHAHAHAHAHATGSNGGAPSVSVQMAGTEETTERLRAALDDALQRLGVVLEIRRIAAAEKPEIPERSPAEAALVARLWIDLTHAKRATLLVVDDHHERVFVRELSLPSGVDEVALEQLVLTASSSIEAILAGQTIGVARREYEASLRDTPPAPPPAPRPSPRPAPAEPTSTARFWGSLSGAYALGLLGPGAIVHGPSLGLELRRLSFGVGLHVLGRLPVLVGDQAIRVRLTSLGFRARGWGSLPLAEGLALLAGLGLGADFMQVSPRSAALEAYVSAVPYWAADGLLQGFFGVAYRARNWSLTGSLGADFAPQAVRYAVETPEGAREVFRPFRLRPFLAVELSAHLLH